MSLLNELVEELSQSCIFQKVDESAANEFMATPYQSMNAFSYDDNEDDTAIISDLTVGYNPLNEYKLALLSGGTVVTLTEAFLSRDKNGILQSAVMAISEAFMHASSKHFGIVFQTGKQNNDLDNQILKYEFFSPSEVCILGGIKTIHDFRNTFFASKLSWVRNNFKSHLYNYDFDKPVISFPRLHNPPHQVLVFNLKSSLVYSSPKFWIDTAKNKLMFSFKIGNTSTDWITGYNL